MSKVDWSKAPEDAEFYSRGSFRKISNSNFGVPHCFCGYKGKWMDGTFTIGNLIDSPDYEKRPEKPITDVSQANQAKPEKDGNKYHREIIGFCGTMVEVDVYRVLDAFKTGSPAIDHAVKKMLCTGIRGHKDYLTDIDNAIESLQEAKLLYLQKHEINKA